MMKYYQDITLLPDAEANLGFLWYKVYQQVHLALVENKIGENQSAIAVSFPDYENKTYPLGDKLRLFSATEVHLQKLNINQWLSRLMDYVHIKPIKTVPENVNIYACFKRRQFKSNLMKEAARRAKYKNESLEDAINHFKHYKTESKLPYINIRSLSTDCGDESRRFKIFIERNISKEKGEGVFNCYGLSKTATVPWF